MPNMTKVRTPLDASGVDIREWVLADGEVGDPWPSGQFPDKSVQVMSVTGSAIVQGTNGSDFRDAETTASATIGTGDNGSVVITADDAGDAGNDFTVEVVDGVGLDQALDASIVGSDITVTLGTDGSGDPDPTKNTATLIAAAVAALTGVTAAATGTGVDDIDTAEGPTQFTGGADGSATNQWVTLFDQDGNALTGIEDGIPYLIRESLYALRVSSVSGAVTVRVCATTGRG